MMVRNLYILFAFIINYCLNAQDLNYKFEHLTMNDGLSSNSFTCICQDETGFLWIGSYYGLNRYSGYDFKKYLNNSNNPDSISNNFVRSLFIDHDGNLWIGTSGGGLNWYDKENDAFISFQHDTSKKSSISNNFVNAINQDDKGNIWIGTWGGGLDRIDFSINEKDTKQSDKIKSIKFIHYKNDTLNKSSVAGDKINSIYADSYGLLWIATKFGISILDPQTNNFTNLQHNPDDPLSLSGNNVTSVCEDRWGNVWAGTWDAGLNKYDRSKKTFTRYYRDVNDKNSINNNGIMKLYKDRSGKLYIGAWGGGLNVLMEPSGKNVTFENLKSGYPQDKFISLNQTDVNETNYYGNYVYSIFEDRSGVLWIGTEVQGLFKFDRDKVKFNAMRSQLNKKNTLNDNSVISIYLGDNNRLWLGTRSGGVNVYNKNTGKFSYYVNDPLSMSSLSNNNVKCIFKDENENLWFGTAEGLNLLGPDSEKFTRYYHDPLRHSNSNIMDICEDEKGNLWLATYGDGLVKFNIRKKEFTVFRNDPDNSKTISDNTLLDVFIDSDGILWIASQYGGLSRFDLKNEEFVNYRYNKEIKNTLSSNQVNYIFEGPDRDMWFGTGRGLDKLKRTDIFNNKPSFKIYIQNDGLPSNYIAGILEDDKNNLWISTSIGISKFNLISGEFENFNTSDGLQSIEFAPKSLFKDEETGIMYFGGYNGFNYFHPDSIRNNTIIPNVVLTDLKIYNKSVKINEEVDGRIVLTNSLSETNHIKLSYKSKVISFEFAALHFNSPADNQYAYKLIGFDPSDAGWNLQGNKREAIYTNLNPGDYIFRVRASNNDGLWNEEGLALKITVVPPWWQTWLFRIFFIIFIISAFIGIYLNRVNNLKQRQIYLEQQVRERTAKIEQQNSLLNETNATLEERQQQIEEQAEELRAQKEELSRVNDNLNETNTRLEERQQRIEEQKEELKTQAEELSKANAELEETNKTKDRFFSIIAHDLKNPFNTIFGFAQLLQLRKSTLTDDKRDLYIDSIFGSSKKIYSLLENLLQWSRMQSNRIKFNQSEFSLFAVVNDAKLLLKENASQKEISVLNNIDNSFKCKGDVDMVNTVVRNLISNSIKYTPVGGEIKIGASLKDNFAEVNVSDNGVGIPQKIINDLFKIDKNTSTAGTRGEEGTGLGLILCKDFINRNGGKIWVESEEGKGATFFFTIPVS